MSEQLFPGWENLSSPGLYPGWEHLLDTQINPAPARKRARKTPNPATESSVAQGCRELEELYFSDTNCKSTVLSTFNNFDQNPRV